MTSREPTRSQRIMQNLQGFHDSVVTSAAEARAGKTSRHSPFRASAATRQQLTGVRENVDAQGWTSAEALPHLCFPPDQYPSGVGPESTWTCRCGAVWRANGIAWDEYPTDPTRTAQPLKPESWRYVEGGQLPAVDYEKQEPLYDWRPLGPYYVKLYRAMIDNQVATMEGRMRDTTDWRELG